MYFLILKERSEKMKKLLVFLCLLLLMAFSAPAFAMTITPYDSANNFAQSLAGPGITINNASYTGATAASGYFSGGIAAGIGIESGIVLTSGAASNLQGTSNTSDGISTSNALPGDAQLDDLITQLTYDATVLEFDFSLTTGDTAYFNFVFGSEEYNEYVDSFNDVFGFFVGGINYALIPGTTTPVSINNVNNGDNSAYYNDNDPSDLGTPTPYPFEYDGFTDVFGVTIDGLTAGNTYNIALNIADAADYALDSGVFIQGGTFSDTPTDPIPEPATMLLLGSGLIGLAGFGRKKFFKKS